MLKKDKLIRISRFVTLAGLVVNRLFLAAVALALLVSFLFYTPLATLFVQQSPATDVRQEFTGLRLMMLIGILMSVAIDRLLVPLTQIIETARAGDPFISVNAHRLRAIGWALLALQLLDIPVALIEKHFPAMQDGAPDSPFSIAGWMAVLMVFALSRVFTLGAAMRGELEGTV